MEIFTIGCLSPRSTYGFSLARFNLLLSFLSHTCGFLVDQFWSSFDSFFLHTDPFFPLANLQHLHQKGIQRYEDFQTLLNLTDTLQPIPSTLIFLENSGCVTLPPTLQKHNLAQGSWSQCFRYDFPNTPSQSWLKILTTLSSSMLGQQGS